MYGTLKNLIVVKDGR